MAKGVTGQRRVRIPPRVAALLARLAPDLRRLGLLALGTLLLALGGFLAWQA